MARKRIRDIRHEEFVEATIVAAHRHGYHAVTMAEIAKEAGAATASISYYFGSKDGLMEATMLHLLRKLKTLLLERYAAANSPRKRLYAILDANFDDSLFTVPQCSIWMQFWASAPYSARLARLHKINRRRVRSQIRAELQKLLPEGEAETARKALQCYMDGVWLEVAQSETDVSAKAARQAAREVADLLLKTT